VKIQYIPSRIISKLVQIIGHIFAFDRGGMFLLMHSFGVIPYHHDYKNCPQETRNIALSCGVKCILISLTEFTSVTDGRTDRQTDR